MKRKSTYKLLLFSVITFSALSFIAVNGHASFTAHQQILNTEIQKQVEADEQQNQMPIPDITMLGKVVEFVKKFI